MSGVLLIALNNACKVMPLLQNLDKEYVGVMHLHKDVDDALLNKAVSAFVGKIKQRPPVRSAVARKERFRTVRSFEIIERGGRDVLFRISCQAGTYVRVVCHSIGTLIGGAHMAELRRTKVGPFSEQQCVKIHDLADAYAEWKENELKKLILPVEAAIPHVKKAFLKKDAVHSITNGSPLYSSGVESADDIKKDDMVAVMHSGKLIAIGKAKANKADFAKTKGPVISTDRVIAKKL